MFMMKIEDLSERLLSAENNCKVGNTIFSKVRKTIDGKKFNDILDVYLFTYNSEVSLKNATTNEVANVKWLTVAEIKELYENGLLVDSLKYFFDKIANL